MLNEFSNDQKAKIAKVINKPPQTESSLKNSISVEALKLLIELNLVSEIPPTGRERVSRFEFTNETKGLFSQIKIPSRITRKTKPKKAPRREKPKTSTLDMKILEPLILQLISPRFDVLEKRIIDLENLIKSNNVEISSTTRSIIPTMDEFTLHLKKQWQELDRIYRWGGRVEIPLLRERTRNISRDTFDNYLLELEKKGVIDLQVASDPSVIIRSKDGIKHPIRGLIYYLIFRN